MKQLLVLLIIGACVGCASTKTTKTNYLNGVWIPVKQEMGGKELTSAAFATQKLIINDSNYTFSAESVDKGILKFSDNKIDIYGKEGINIGKHFTTIYKYENELLTICYNLLGNSYPAVFDTKGKPTLFMSVYKKEVKK